MSKVDDLARLQATAYYDPAVDVQMPAACRNGDCHHAQHLPRRVGRGNVTGTGFGYGAYGGSWVAPLQGAQFAGAPQMDTQTDAGNSGDGGGDSGV